MTVIAVLRNAGSAGARRLANALHIPCVTSGALRSTRGDRYLINWGCSQQQPNLRQRRLTLSNSFESVAKCQDKLKTFQALGDVPCLDWHAGGPRGPIRIYEDADTVGPASWLEQDGKIIVRRTTTGHSGAGIEVVRRGSVIPTAPLYTRYWKKDAEYRVHVAFGQAILIQQKRRRNGHERDERSEEHLIRVHANGYVFTINNLDCDQLNYRTQLSTLALDACRAVGASHCAVDVLVRHPNRRRNQVEMVVCEVNSAPALEADSTRDAYVRAFNAEFTRLGIR